MIWSLDGLTHWVVNSTVLLAGAPSNGSLGRGGICLSFASFDSYRVAGDLQSLAANVL